MKKLLPLLAGAAAFTSVAGAAIGLNISGETDFDTGAVEVSGCTDQVDIQWNILPTDDGTATYAGLDAIYLDGIDPDCIGREASVGLFRSADGNGSSHFGSGLCTTSSVNADHFTGLGSTGYMKCTNGANGDAPAAGDVKYVLITIR